MRLEGTLEDKGNQRQTMNDSTDSGLATAAQLFPYFSSKTTK
jgi:hypothetical protein